MAGRFEITTDNAYIRADIATISPKVQGYVEKVHVTDNQAVKAGDLLVTLEVADYATRVSEAAAALQQSIAAEAHFQERLSIRNRLQPESHLVSEALAFLADVALAAGNTAAEADLLQRSLAVSLTSNGYDHPTSQKLLARTLTAVATVNGESAAKQVETDFGQSRPGPDRPTYDSLIGPETYREPIQPIGIGEVIVIRNSPARIESGGNFTAEAGNSFWALAEKNGEYRVALAGEGGAALAGWRDVWGRTWRH